MEHILIFAVVITWHEVFPKALLQNEVGNEYLQCMYVCMFVCIFMIPYSSIYHLTSLSMYIQSNLKPILTVSPASSFLYFQISKKNPPS